MRIDWQQYEDGQMEPGEKQQAERALASDSSARAELEGLRKFRKLVREAGLQEPVPSKQLHETLASVVGRKGLPLWRRRAANLAAAALGLVVLGIGVGKAQASGWLFESRLTTDNAGDANTWVAQRCGLEVPYFDFKGKGTLTSVHGRRGWACFDFLIANRPVHVFVESGLIEVAGKEQIQSGNTALYRDKKTGDVAFVGSGLTFFVKGADESDSIDLATSLAKSCDSQALVVP